MHDHAGFVNVNSLLKRINLKEIINLTHPGYIISNRGASRCPLHGDVHPSFAHRTVDDVDQWICFSGCGKGTAIDWVKVALGYSTEEAIRYLIDIVSEIDPDFVKDNVSLTNLSKEVQAKLDRDIFWEALLKNTRMDLLQSEEAKSNTLLILVRFHFLFV